MRRRGRFGEGADEYENLTKFEEEYVRPTDAAASAPAQAPTYSSSYGDKQYDFSSLTGAAPSTSTQTATAERPMVFALRKYKNVYVYEYSDRLEFFENTPNGMERINIEYKKR